MNIRMRQLKVFKTVVEAGTVSEAAQGLSLTQSSVSKTLAALEEELGFLLFDRIGRRLKPSREGRLFYKKIENALETFEGIQTAAEDIRDNQGRRLRVCAIGPLLCSQLIPRALAQFSRSHPDFNFSVDMIPRIEIEEWMAQRHSDLGFTLLPVETSQLNFESLATVNAVAIVPVGHRFATRATLSAKDCTNEHLIMPRPAVRVRALVEASFVDAGVNLQVKTQTTSAIAMAHLVGNGLGMGILDPFTVTGSQSQNLVALPWRPEIHLSYGVIWPKTRTLSSNELAFIETVREVTTQVVQNFR